MFGLSVLRRVEMSGADGTSFGMRNVLRSIHVTNSSPDLDALIAQKEQPPTSLIFIRLFKMLFYHRNSNSLGFDEEHSNDAAQMFSRKKVQNYIICIR